MVKVDLPDGQKNYDAAFVFWDGETLWNEMNPDVSEQEVYGYEWSEEAPIEEHTPTGWYLLDNNGVYFCMNDKEIPYGSGIAIDCNDNNAQVVFSGNVETKDAKINLTKGGFNYTGNCMPAKWSLKDIVAGGGYTPMSKLKFFNNGGGMIKVDLPDGQKNYDAAFVFWDGEALWNEMNPDVSEQEVYGYEWSEEAPIEEHTPTGWYLLDDNGVYFCMNESESFAEIEAGFGFTIDCNDNNAFIVVPTPVQVSK